MLYYVDFYIIIFLIRKLRFRLVKESLQGGSVRDRNGATPHQSC